MTSNGHLQSVRADLPAIHRYIYLNTGTCGPLPRPAIEAMALQAQDEADWGRIRFEVYEQELWPKMARLRAAFGRLMGVRPEEIALSHNTTDGLNTAIWGQPWTAGDEIVVTDLEHEGGVMPAVLAARKFGLKLRTLRLLDLPADDMPNVVADELGPRSRLLIISHVSWANGVLVPLAQVVEAAHARGCQVAVDGAQSAGATPLALAESGVDYYAVPGQKWLCGPEGIGALYVRRERWDHLSPTYTGYYALDERAKPAWDCFGRLVLAPDARRYEASSIYHPAVSGMLASLAWLEEKVGWEWIFARMERLREYARERLSANPHLSIFTPPQAAGLLHFYLPEGVDVAQVDAGLAARGIRIRRIPHMNCLRLSTGFWNTEEEVDALVEALEELVGR
ncbi:MAG: aminotransferase class V-fold PLP-dependent enzyme [Caldilineae bacterium]|nr:MAG: aminotransferase class V-fold PLP-dependent enzyme [Caldilineae bacterium]